MECASGVKKCQQHQIAHIAVKIAGMIMSNIEGRTEAHKCKQSENSQKSTEEVMKR